MKIIKTFFYFLFKPEFWYMNYSYSEIIDDVLNYDLDNCEIGSINGYELIINSHRYWIGNYPYAYGYIRGLNVRPSRFTILKLRERHIKHIVSEQK